MSFQVQGTASNILKGLDRKTRSKINKSVNKIAKKVNTQLKTRMTNHSNRYKSGDNIGVYDEYKSSKDNRPRSISGWRMSHRTHGIKSDSISYQFRNEVHHAVYLYGKSSSNGNHLRSSKNRNFRSAKNHLPVYRKGKTIGSRSNQLTAQKWKRFKEDIRSQMKKGILNGK
jgi:hypothetical protein